MKIKEMTLRKTVPVGAYRTISYEVVIELQADDTLSVVTDKINAEVNQMMEHIMNVDKNTGFTPFQNPK